MQYILIIQITDSIRLFVTVRVTLSPNKSVIKNVFIQVTFQLINYYCGINYPLIIYWIKRKIMRGTKTFIKWLMTVLTLITTFKLQISNKYFKY